MHIYLLRHGRTASPGTYSGVSDVDLSDEGRAEISRVVKLVNSINLECCYCSPLIRCTESAALLDLKCRVTYDSGLREIDFGRWEGLSFEQISQTDPDHLKSWQQQKEDFRFPGGDLIREFNGEIDTWFERLLLSSCKRVLIVSHGGVIRQALCYLLGLSSETAFSFAVREAALSLVSCEYGFNQLKFLNRRGA